MHKTILLLAFLSSLTPAAVAPAAAQEGFRVSSVMIGSGESPIASGIIAIVDLKTEKGGFVEVAAQQEQAWLMMGRDFVAGRRKCSLYAATGHFQAAPWVGAHAGCVVTLGTVGGQKLSVEGMARPGIMLYREPESFRNDGVENPEDLFTAQFYLTQIKLGGLSFNYAYLNFLDLPTNHLPGIAYSHYVTPEVEITGSATWNSNALDEKTGDKGRFMYFIGATWFPERK